MKNYISKIALFICLFVLVVGCYDDDGPVVAIPQEDAENLLLGRWNLQAANGVVVDNVDRSLNYEGFTISFTSTGYSTSNAGDLFQATGTWEWADDTTDDQIIFDDGKNIQIQQLNLTGNTFKLVIVFSQSDGGVRAGIAGNYVISMQR